MTRQPGLITEEDIKPMRKGGCTDEEILRANLIISYFNFVNRIATGLGVPLENAAERDYKY